MTERRESKPALDAEAIKLLKSDPEKYFRRIRRNPFDLSPPQFRWMCSGSALSRHGSWAAERWSRLCRMFRAG